MSDCRHVFKGAGGRNFYIKLWSYNYTMLSPDTLFINMFHFVESAVKADEAICVCFKLFRNWKMSFTECSESESVSISVISYSLRPRGLWPTMLLCPWDSSGKDTGVGCCFLLQEILPTQGLNLGLFHCCRFFTLWTISETDWM